MENNSNILKFERLKTQDQLERLKTFANSFSHYITLEDVSFVVLIVIWQDKWLGYIKIFNNAIGFLCLKPNPEIPPRIENKVIEWFNAWARINAPIIGQPCMGFVAKGDDSPISDETLKRHGIVDSGFRLFKFIE